MPKDSALNCVYSLTWLSCMNLNQSITGLYFFRWHFEVNFCINYLSWWLKFCILFMSLWNVNEYSISDFLESTNFLLTWLGKWLWNSFKVSKPPTIVWYYPTSKTKIIVFLYALRNEGNTSRYTGFSSIPTKVLIFAV